MPEEKLILRCRVCGTDIALVDGRELTAHVHDKHGKMVVPAAMAMGSYMSSFLFAPADRSSTMKGELYKEHRKAMIRGFESELARMIELERARNKS